ncbi:MAG: hypothetical protein K1X82_15340, partial [Bacteroidia bacterium]|nr:hypothetical protein [Bacteroidia bacterium]
MPEINQPIVKNQSPEDTSSPFSNDQGFTFRNDPIDPNQKPLSEMSPEELQDMQTRYQNLAGNNKPFEQGIESAPGDEKNYAINNYGNEGWLESWKKSWFSGIGDIETSFAGTFKALGYDDIADEWYKSGMNRVERNKNFVSKDLGEFSADDLLNPYYYSKIMGRSLPSNVALTGTAVAAGVLTGGIGTAATAIAAAAARQAAVNIVIDQLSGGSTKGLFVPTKGKLLQSIIAGTVATLTEAGMEGGSLFKEMIEQGVDEKTAKDAFNKTVAANMLLGVTNLAQFAQFLNPVAKGIMKGGVVSETIEAFQKRFLNSTAKQLLANTVTEGLEEVYQGAIQAKAKEGGDWGDFITGLPSAMATRLTTSEGWGEMAAGAVFGGAMGAVPAAYRSITGKSLAYKEAIDKLSDARIAVEDGDWVKSTRPFVAKMFELFEKEIGSNQTVGVKVG